MKEREYLQNETVRKQERQEVFKELGREYKNQVKEVRIENFKVEIKAEELWDTGYKKIYRQQKAEFWEIALKEDGEHTARRKSAVD